MTLFKILAGLAALAAPNADRDTVAKLDRTYQEAVKRNDADTMMRILHPQFLLVLGDGQRIGRDDLIAAVRRGRYHFELQDEEPGTQSVLVWGDTAIVTAKLILKGTVDGRPVDRTLWFSDTYVRTDSGWRYLFGQASLPLPPEPKVSANRMQPIEHPFAIGYWPAGGF